MHATEESSYWQERGNYMEGNEEHDKTHSAWGTRARCTAWRLTDFDKTSHDRPTKSLHMPHRGIFFLSYPFYSICFVFVKGRGQEVSEEIKESDRA